MKKYKELPIEEGKTYMTSMQCSELFKVEKLDKTKAWGIYLNRPHLGICPINLDRLTADKIEFDEIIEYCVYCKKPINNEKV